MAAKKQILVCDDDPLFRKTLEIALREHGATTPTANSDEAIQLLRNRTFDLLVLDIQMRTKDEGLRALPKIRAVDPDIVIIVVSGLKDFQTVREAMTNGANDYLPKDFEPEELRLALERSLENRELRMARQKSASETRQLQDRHAFVGEAESVLRVKKLIDKFKQSAANVLITGETGTGKEIAARQLRKRFDDGSYEPFMAIDSATLHASTAESLLFGHEKGAFTGADTMKKGLFEEADGGVVFFDEIGNMPLAIQAKLLRVLQEKEITRLGSTKVIPLDFRVVAATNRSLDDMVEKKEFLGDLLQRLNVLPIELPPLRERISDIQPLVMHLVRRKTSARIRVTDDAMGALRAYGWPGNVRELAAMLDYSLAMIDGEEIDVTDLHPKLREPARERAGGGDAEAISFYDQVSGFERQILAKEYARHDGNVSQMALSLGMDRSHLHQKLKAHGVHTAKTRG